MVASLKHFSYIFPNECLSASTFGNVAVFPTTTHTNLEKAESLRSGFSLFSFRGCCFFTILSQLFSLNFPPLCLLNESAKRLDLSSFFRLKNFTYSSHTSSNNQINLILPSNSLTNRIGAKFTNKKIQDFFMKSFGMGWCAVRSLLLRPGGFPPLQRALQF